MEIILLIFVGVIILGCLSAFKGPVGDIANMIWWIIRKGAAILAILAIISLLFGGI